MANASVGLLPVDVDLLGLLADGQTVDLGVVVLDGYVEEEVGDASLGQVLQGLFLDLPLVFGYKGLLFQLECSLFEFVYVQPELLFLLL